MGNQWFKFKQFEIKQDQCAMKVGTDGVLLGAWTNVDKTLRTLDIRVSIYLSPGTFTYNYFPIRCLYPGVW